MPKGIRASGLRCVLRNEQGLYWRGTSEPTKPSRPALRTMAMSGTRWLSMPHWRC